MLIPPGLIDRQLFECRSLAHHTSQLVYDGKRRDCERDRDDLKSLAQLRQVLFRVVIRQPIR
jgi:hypothetical protein